MGETQAEFMLRDEIATEIVHISRRLMQRTARAMESLNVGFGQAAILKVLSDHGEMAQRRLAEEIRVTPATVCGTLKRMERAGLIERRRGRRAGLAGAAQRGGAKALRRGLFGHRAHLLRNAFRLFGRRMPAHSRRSAPNGTESDGRRGGADGCTSERLNWKPARVSRPWPA